MDFKVKVCDEVTELKLTDSGLAYFADRKEKLIDYCDIIGLEKTDENGKRFNLHFIKDHPFPNHKLTRECMEIASAESIFIELQILLTSKINTGTDRPKTLAVFVNPIGGKGRGEQEFSTTVLPVLTLAGIKTDVIVSQKPGHAKEFGNTFDMKSADGLVIMGGDGTISEIFNVLMRRTQEEAGVNFNDHNVTLKTMEFPIAVIPTGTGNGLANIIHGCKDTLTSTLHIIKGRKSKMHTLGNYNRDKLLGYCIVCLTYGLYSEIMYHLDEYYRWLRQLRFVFVPIWYMLIRPYREIDVQITYEYLKGNEPPDLTQDEKISLKVVQKKKITNLLGLAYSLDWDDLPLGQRPESQDQFDLFDYRKCSRWSLMRHFYNLYHFSKEHIHNARDFLKHSEVTGFNLQVTDDNNPGDKELNLLYNIDGEVYKLQTPNVYVKLIPRCYTVYSSYNGPKRWW